MMGMRGETRDRVRELRIERVVELVPPIALLGDLPLGEEREAAVVRGREQAGEILDGSDDRLLVVVGPCSVHDVEAALDYAGRLAEAASELRDDLLVAMRVYFEKPRTTTGWKGLINDPYLDGSCDVNAGLRMARTLLLKVLDLGLAVGCEFLDPITPQYISDTVAWGAIGARTTESQIHRQLGSGLSMPIGFKNRTDGNVQVAVDAVRAAAAPHAFAGIDDAGRPAILHTAGNPDGHVILRGGQGAPNCGPEGVAAALEKLRAAGLAERLVIDASHDNSEKDPAKQIAAAGRDRRAGGRRQRGDRRPDAGVVPGRGPPGSRRRPTRSSTASRSPIPASTGRRRRGAGAVWPRRCGHGAENEGRRPRGGPDRRLDRARRAAAAGGRGGRLGPEPLDAGAGRGARGDRPAGGLGRGGLRRRRRRLLRGAGRRPDRAGAGGARGERPGHRGHRRRLDQARIVAELGDDERFIGGHPLAGAETAGVENARADLFEGARWYLTPTERSGGILYDRLQRTIAELGARPQAIDAAAHDRLMATVSHLPHVLANVLVGQAAAELTEDSERMPEVGPSFRDATRVAGSNPAIWGDIFTANREAVVAAIDDAVARLGEAGS